MALCSWPPTPVAGRRSPAASAVCRPERHPPDGLVLQGIGVGGVGRQQHAAHRDVLLLGHHHGIRGEDWTLVDVPDGDVDGGRGAGAVGDVGHQRVLVLHLDQQGVEGGDLVVQGLEGRRERQGLRGPLRADSGPQSPADTL